MSKKNIPELLCPAGSVEALDAAIEGGANAVYLGGTAMNARIHAGNFNPQQLRDAVRLAHAHGVKVYLTLNTLVTDREMNSYLDAARDACRAGVDALIVADLGGACAIRRILPTVELHASTQMSGHNSRMGEALAKLGFSRMVAAREISEANLRELMANSPIETELFVHGALCVSHSGQCLFSSIVGGRSGNRGECAQPCRLPYGKRESYPLSLKDLTLSKHIPTLIELGVASLKIEGRMKSPEYVYETARVFRRLLDEGRGATDSEIERMARRFSRSGFTDGYFTERIGSSMLGVRREQDKQNTKELESFSGLQRRVPIALSATLHEGKPATLTVSDGRQTVTVTGDEVMRAITSPMSGESVKKSLCKLGNTPYEATDCRISMDENIMLPVSRLNDLRRRAIDALETANAPKEREERDFVPSLPAEERVRAVSARFYTAEQITPRAKDFFPRRFLPLFSYSEQANGVVLPPVIFDRDLDRVRRELTCVRERGARYALVGNLGHLLLVLEAGLEAVGDFRLNVTNTESASQYELLGIKENLLSPELTMPQMRDVKGNTAAIVYGRLPLMTLEKCVQTELSGCAACRENKGTLTDRRGVSFPVLREWEHRSLVCNSVPTSMTDRGAELSRNRLTNLHFLFTVESPEEVDRVIDAHRHGRPVSGQVRRIAT
jgi:putative protease